MNTKEQSSNRAIFTNESVDAFLSIAGIYFDSSERLAELTLAANRRALEDFVAQSRRRSDTETGLMSGQFDTTQMQPMFERALTYSRNVAEVLMQAQLNAGKILGKHLTPQMIRFPLSEEWQAAAGTMSEGVRAFYELNAAAASSAEAQAHHVTEAVTKTAKAA
jgi:phasin family protein